MSHVDDGTLHAYLDGELTPVERERTEGHLAGCAACRARLDEARTLVERAGRLLGLAAPPERPAPPLTELRRPPRGGAGYRLPLAWAATVALAIGIGWYARGVREPTPGAAELAATSPDTVAPAAASPLPPPPSPASPAGARRAQRQDEAPAPTSLATATADQVAPDTVGARLPAAQPVAPPAAKAAPEARGAVAAGRAEANAVVAVSAEVPKDADLWRSATWPEVGPERAREVLGVDPAAIPGMPIRALRRNPVDTSEIVVEQMVRGEVVFLFERRGDRQAREALGQGHAANERLARYVRSLRVEIAGALSADSLSALLGSIR